VRARQHHYLPAAYLSGFADPVSREKTGKDVVYVYEPGKPIRAANPRKEARVRDLYSLESHPQPDAVETHLSGLEAAGLAAIRAIRIGERLFTSKEREALAQFMGVMFTRTPAAMKYSEEVAGPAANRIVLKLATDAEQFAAIWTELTGDAPEAPFAEEARQKILNGWYEKNETKDDSVVSMLAVGQMAAEEMANLHWQVIRTSRHAAFITSDFPIIGARREGNRVSLGVGFTHPNSDFFFPLSRSLMLRMASDLEEGHGYIPPRGARLANGYFMRYAEKRIFASVRSDRILSEFERLHGEVRLGFNALVPIWEGKPILEEE